MMKDKLYIEVVKAPPGESCDYTYKPERANQTVVFDDGTLAYYDGKTMMINYMMSAPMQLLVREMVDTRVDPVLPLEPPAVFATAEKLDSGVVAALLEKGTVKDIVALRKEGLI